MKKFLRLVRLGAIASAVGIIVLSIWSFAVEPQLVVIRRHEIELAAWPEKFDGYRVLLLSDIHDFPRPRYPGKLRRILDAVKSEGADLVLLLGDFTCLMPERGEDESFPELRKFISGLHAPDGVYGVLGNHEPSRGRDLVASAFTAGGAVMLENRFVMIQRGDAAFRLGGFPVYSLAEPVDNKRITEGMLPGEPLLVIAHEPDSIMKAPAAMTLMFSGHTHGGQLRLPGIGSLHALFAKKPPPGSVKSLGFHPYLNTYQSKLVYVSSGLGGDRVTARLFCPPEINVITLRAPGRAKDPLPVREAWERN